jgi:hypothetical protein
MSELEFEQDFPDLDAFTLAPRESLILVFPGERSAYGASQVRERLKGLFPEFHILVFLRPSKTVGHE